MGGGISKLYSSGASMKLFRRVYPDLIPLTGVTSVAGDHDTTRPDVSRQFNDVRRFVDVG